MTVSEQIRQGACRLSDIPNPLLDTQLLLAHVLGKDRLYLMMYPERELSKQESALMEELLRKREGGYPLQYILGKREFMGLEFIVKEGVLIPRPETEVLVEGVLEHFGERKKMSLQGLEIGCGSGIISISLLKYCPALQMTAVDINPKALDLTMENAERLGVADRLTVLESDLFDVIPKQAQYDLIVSNPPYIQTTVIDTLQVEVRAYEPREALDGREDGLFFYRAITKNAKNHLKEGGLLALEIGYDQGSFLREELYRHRYRKISIGQDLAGLDRTAYGFR